MLCLLTSISCSYIAQKVKGAEHLESINKIYIRQIVFSFYLFGLKIIIKLKKNICDKEANSPSFDANMRSVV